MQIYFKRRMLPPVSTLFDDPLSLFGAHLLPLSQSVRQYGGCPTANLAPDPANRRNAGLAGITPMAYRLTSATGHFFDKKSLPRPQEACRMAMQTLPFFESGAVGRKSSYRFQRPGWSDRWRGIRSSFLFSRLRRLGGDAYPIVHCRSTSRDKAAVRPPDRTLCNSVSL